MDTLTLKKRLDFFIEKEVQILRNIEIKDKVSQLSLYNRVLFVIASIFEVKVLKHEVKVW